MVNRMTNARIVRFLKACKTDGGELLVTKIQEILSRGCRQVDRILIYEINNIVAFSQFWDVVPNTMSGWSSLRTVLQWLSNLPVYKEAVLPPVLWRHTMFAKLRNNTPSPAINRTLKYLAKHYKLAQPATDQVPVEGTPAPSAVPNDLREAEIVRLRERVSYLEEQNRILEEHNRSLATRNDSQFRKLQAVRSILA